MHAEGGITDEMRRAFAEARLIEQFIPLRSFDVPFSPNTEETAVQYPHSQEKLVRYAQSYSLVEVLKEEFGWEKIGSPDRSVQVRHHRRRRAETGLRDRYRGNGAALETSRRTAGARSQSGVLTPSANGDGG